MPSQEAILLDSASEDTQEWIEQHLHDPFHLVGTTPQEDQGLARHASRLQVGACGYLQHQYSPAFNGILFELKHKIR